MSASVFNKRVCSESLFKKAHPLFVLKENSLPSLLWECFCLQRDYEKNLRPKNISISNLKSLYDEQILFDPHNDTCEMNLKNRITQAFELHDAFEQLQDVTIEWLESKEIEEKNLYNILDWFVNLLDVNLDLITEDKLVEILLLKSDRPLLHLVVAQLFALRMCEKINKNTNVNKITNAFKTVLKYIDELQIENTRASLKWMKVQCKIKSSHFSYLTTQVIFFIPFVRCAEKILNSVMHELRETKPITEIEKSIFDPIGVEKLKKNLKFFYNKLFSTKNYVLDEDDINEFENLVRFTNILTDEARKNLNILLKDYETSEKTCLRQRCVFTGVACCCKTTILDMLTKKQKEEGKEIEIRNRGACGGFHDKSENVISVVGLHAAYETHCRHGNKPISDRGTLDNPIWAIIMRILDERVDSDSEQDAVSLVVDIFLKHTNLATLAYFMRMSHVVVLETNSEYNKDRMYERKTSGDIHRATVNRYVSSQTFVYGLMCIIFKYKHVFTKYEPNSRKISLQYFEKVVFEIKGIINGKHRSRKINRKRKINDNETNESNKKQILQTFTKVTGLEYIQINKKIKDFHYSKDICVYK